MTAPMQDDPRDKVRRNVEKMAAQGASESEIETYVQAQGIQPVRKPPVMAPRESSTARMGSKPTSAQNPATFLAPIANGLTLGFADEALGAVEGANRKLSGGSFSEGYAEGRDKVRTGMKDFAERNPKTNTALNIAGGIIPAAATSGATLVRAGMPLARKAVALGAEGAMVGGAAGAGNAEGDLGARTRGALEGGVAGGVLGAAIPVAGAGVGLARNIIGRRGESAARQGDALLSRSLSRDLVEPMTLAPVAGKPMILADFAGENTTGLVRGAQATPSKAKESLADFLRRRAEGQPSRVLDDVEQAAGQRNADVHDVAEQLLQKKRATAAPLYEEAYAHGIVDITPVRDALKIPAFQKAYRRAQRIAETDGVTLGTLDAPTVQTVDYMKRGMDDLIEAGFRKGSIGKTEARALKKRLTGVLEAVDEVVPAYKQARAQYAGDAAMENALKKGREFLTEDFRVSQKQLAALTEGERELYTTGAVDAIRRQMDEAADGADVVKRVFGNPRKRAQLKVLLGESFDGLEQRLTAESQMVRTKDRVLGGSPTARILGELDELGAGRAVEIADKAASALTGGGWGVARAATRAALDVAKRRARGNVGEVADHIAQKAMLQPGTPEYTAWLAVLKAAQQKSASPATTIPRRTIPRALSAGAGSASQ